MRRVRLPIVLALALLAVVLAVVSSAPETFAQTTPVDYDFDNDRLIEISYLEQLNAVRWDLDGNGASTNSGYGLAFPDALAGMGCPDGDSSTPDQPFCEGYELDDDLDFTVPADYAGGVLNTAWTDDPDDPADTGWLPIGDSTTGFSGFFEGNGHTISNLFINRETTDSIGLFARLEPGSAIRGLGVVGMDVTGRDQVGGLAGRTFGPISDSYATGAVSGRNGVGGLVSFSRGTITGSYATGAVSGNHRVGGLMGQNEGTITGSYATSAVSGGNDVGGLVGWNLGTITASYATGAVSGNQRVGGLSGWNNKGLATIAASYATGAVSGNNGVGGLVGWNSTDEIVRPSITGSYATGRVSGNHQVGGLAGVNFQATITASYFDTDTTGITGSRGRTTRDLQLPTGYDGIYSTWAAGSWHFGADNQYPALVVDFDGDADTPATWQEFGYQLREGPAPDYEINNGQVMLTWTAPATSHWTPPPAITYAVYREGAEVTDDDPSTPLTLTDAGVTTGESYEYQVVAIVNGGEASRSAPLSAYVSNEPPAVTSEASFSTEENETLAGTVTSEDADDSITGYTLGGDDYSSFSITLSGENGVLTFKTAPDFEVPGSLAGTNVYTITVTATGGAGDRALDSDPQTVTVTVTDANDPPVFSSGATPSVEENTVDVVNPLAASDQDGDTVTFSIDATDAATGGEHRDLFEIASGVLRFKAAPDFENGAGSGSDSNIYEVIVTASDGTVSVTQTDTVTVTDANDPPVFSSGATPSVPENTVDVVTLEASDQDAGDTVTFSIDATDAATGGEHRDLFEIASGVLRFRAAPDFENGAGSGSDSNIYEVIVTVTASDGTVSVTQTVTVTVTDANDPPVFSSGATPSVEENTVDVVTLEASDQDAGDTVSFSIDATDAATGGEHRDLFEIASGVLRFKAAPDFENGAGSGSDSNIYEVIVTASDGTVSVTQTDTVTVTDANDPPVFSSGATPNVEENTVDVVNPLAASDQDAGDTVSFSIDATDAVTGGEHRDLFEIASGVLRFKAAPDFENGAGSGSDSNIYEVIVTASDSTVSVAQTVTVTVTGVNEAPSTPALANQQTTQGEAFTYTFDPSADPEGHPVSYTAAMQDGTVLPVWLTFDAGARTFSVTTSDPSLPGDYDMTVTASDDQSTPLTSQASFRLTVAAGAPQRPGSSLGGRGPSDRRPAFGSRTVTNQTYEAGEDVGTVRLPGASGGDGSLRYTLKPTLPAGMSFDSDARTITGTPRAAFSRTRFTYTARDSDGDPAFLRFYISVTVTNVDEGAEILGDIDGEVTEAGGKDNADGGTPTASGSLRVMDPDAGQTFGFVTAGGRQRGAGDLRYLHHHRRRLLDLHPGQRPRRHRGPGRRRHRDR